MNDVTTPIGSSTGFNSVRATRSASIKNTAPPNNDAGSKRLWSGPTIMRTMCGVTRPTKPIVPPMETQTPISALTAMSSVSFTCRTGTPMLRALLSLTAKALSSRE